MMLDNRGMGMVEIVVGFVLLAIVAASFIKIIDLSSDMTQKSVDVQNENNDIKKRYYEGYNYSDNNKQVFSVESPISVELQEWHKEGDFFTEWHKDSSGQFVSQESSSTPFEINTKLYTIRDTKYSTANTVNFFAKYVYEKPLLVTEVE